MKTKLKVEFEYGGLFCTQKPIPASRRPTVEILGVMMPCDPGMVTVLQDGKQRQVPAFALEKCPSINFEALLNQRQIKARKRCGFLFGNGLGAAPQKLLPLIKCPIL